jgi:hypothetical protein
MTFRDLCELKWIEDFFVRYYFTKIEVIKKDLTWAYT